MTQVGLDVKILTTLRVVAVVGFVMMSRLEEREAGTISLPPPPTKRKKQNQPTHDEPNGEKQQEVTLAAKLEQAFQELQAEGARISGRALAKRAHVHRLTCNQWLRERQLEGKERK